MAILLQPDIMQCGNMGDVKCDKGALLGGRPFELRFVGLTQPAGLVR